MRKRGRIVVAGDDDSRDAGPLQAPHLAHEMGQRRPGRPGVVEDVAGVQDEVDVPAEDVGDRRLEAALEVDRPLIAAGVGIDLAVGRVAEVGVGDMGDAQRSGHTRERCLASNSCAFRQGSARWLS